ncbi:MULTISPECIES: Pr6Pr family membrane protein [unclassified Streptomyces]|uniref:Pr6Pr family membrane protein n=1 Tax=unclassified Streptomyces TaxID=2593676 RepID=UPI00225BEBBC|nr:MULTISPECIES: Pr6Pr family membrane protein [unclassified Streptomyces]MCX5123732.1 Pr6Pr family membrane protein [Streptomyces sp. NBC_00347]WUD82596.1 Pr6Pr family membrane protein [Streptomyces sp. NBC_00503]
MELKWARAWYAATAACVAIGVIIYGVLSWQNHMPAVAETGELFQRFGGSPLGRTLNIFAFFTVQSNLIVGATCLLLAINPDRSSTVFRVFRLIGLVGITVTGLVYHVALNGLLALDTWAMASDKLTHLVVPVMAVVGWLAFGPRGLASARVVKLTVLFPLTYMIFTMIRGPLASDWYPYPFANVHALGYLRVVINGVWIGLLFVSLAAGAAWLDRRLSAKQPAPSPQETS